MRRLLIVVVGILLMVAAGSSYAQGPAPTPAKVQNVLESLVGTWTLSEADAAPMGTIEFRWAQGKHYLIMDGHFGSGAESFASSATMSWDRATTDGMILHVVSLLGHSTEHIKVVSDTVSEGKSTGVTMGRRDSGKTRTVRQGPDRFTIHYTDLIVGGQSQPDSKIVFNRVKAASAEQTLRKLEAQLTQAFLKNEVRALDRLLADDLTYGTSDGMTVTKDMIIEVITAGDYEATSLRYNIESVRVYGNAAVVTGQYTSEARLMGEDVSGEVLTTNTWIKRKGKWQCVAVHASEIEGM